MRYLMPRKGKLSGRTLYTAKEYLKMDKYKITGKLKKELEELEKKFLEEEKRRKTKWKKK